MLAEVTPTEFDWMVGVNFKHVLFAAQAVVPQMQARGGGSIINMSSIAWMRGAPALPVYAGAKAAIVGFTNSLARWVAPTASASTRSPLAWRSPSASAGCGIRTSRSLLRCARARPFPMRSRPRTSPIWRCSSPPTTASVSLDSVFELMGDLRRVRTQLCLESALFSEADVA